MSSSYLIGLMAIGFLMLIVGWPWWISVGVIILSLALLAGSEGEQPTAFPDQRPMITAARGAQSEPSKGKPEAAEGERYRDWRDDEKEEGKSGFFVEDMKWSPTAYADGILGVNPMKGAFGGSVGGRTGAFTLDMGPIRFKDDFRFRLYADDKAFNMCNTEAGPIHAWDFRTRKPLFVEPTAQFKPVVKSPDDALDPGLGVPWAKKSDKK